MAVQKHTNTRTHKHYNPTIIHTQRGNKCCFSTIQSVFFTIYMLPTRYTHICFTNENGLKQTDNKTKEKQNILLPPPRQMCWDSVLFQPLWRLSFERKDLSNRAFSRLLISRILIRHNSQSFKTIEIKWGHGKDFPQTKCRRSQLTTLSYNLLNLSQLFPEPAWSLDTHTHTKKW